jgi:uncharacterized cupin superfamily protein
MSREPQQPAVVAEFIAERKKKSAYPEVFAKRVENRVKRQLGNHFGLKNFGVNLTELLPGGMSALMHTHSVQDEFVYVLEGHPTLVTETSEQRLSPGMCVGFPANGEAHHIVNHTEVTVKFLEIGDRLPGDEGSYPHDDLVAKLDDSGKYYFTRKDGSRY